VWGEKTMKTKMYEITLMSDEIKSKFHVENTSKIEKAWKERGMLFMDGGDRKRCYYDLSQYHTMIIEEKKMIIEEKKQ
jgi:hypothetical protein